MLVVNDARHHCILKHRIPFLSLRTLTEKPAFSEIFTLEIFRNLPFRKKCVFGDRFGGIHVDGRPSRRETSPFSNITDTCGRGYSEFHKEEFT